MMEIQELIMVIVATLVGIISLIQIVGRNKEHEGIGKDEK